MFGKMFPHLGSRGYLSLPGPLSAFLTRVRSEVVEMGVDTRRATEGPGDVVDTTSRSPTERNAVDMPVSAAVAEGW